MTGPNIDWLRHAHDATCTRERPDRETCCADAGCDLGHSTPDPDCRECWWLRDHNDGCTPETPHTATCCARRTIMAAGVTAKTTLMTLDEAQRLHDAALAQILPAFESGRIRAHMRADRERLASDLAGLRDCYQYVGPDATPRHLTALRWLDSHAQRYSDGLRRTAALYGVTEGQAS